MSFIDVLNNPEARRIVDSIEDTMSSLKHNQGDEILQDVLQYQITELKTLTGFQYQI